MAVIPKWSVYHCHGEMYGVAEDLHSRYANLKEVILNKLLAKHGDAQLDAQFHEAACMGTLQEKSENKCQKIKGNCTVYLLHPFHLKVPLLPDAHEGGVEEIQG